MPYWRTKKRKSKALTTKDILVLIILGAIIAVAFWKLVIAAVTLGLIVAAVVAKVKANRKSIPKVDQVIADRPEPKLPAAQVPGIAPNNQGSPAPKTEKVNWHAEFKKKVESAAVPTPAPPAPLAPKVHLAYETIRIME